MAKSGPRKKKNSPPDGLDVSNYRADMSGGCHEHILPLAQAIESASLVCGQRIRHHADAGSEQFPMPDAISSSPAKT